MTCRFQPEYWNDGRMECVRRRKAVTQLKILELASHCLFFLAVRKRSLASPLVPHPGGGCRWGRA